MGDYVTPPASLVTRGKAPSSLLRFDTSLTIPALLAVGKSKQSLVVAGIKVGDLVQGFLPQALPGNISLADMVVTGVNALDVYLQNSVALTGGVVTPAPLILLCFRK